MNRRDFGIGLAGGAFGSALAAVESSGSASAGNESISKKKALMHVADDQFDLCTAEDFQFLQRHGVKHF